MNWLERFFHHHNSTQGKSMTIKGVALPTIDLTLPLPTTRKDGTELPVSEIQSVTVLRDSGTGPAEISVLKGPFNGDTANCTDPSPTAGSDIYSYFVTDTAGTKGDTSLPVSITVTGEKPLSPPAAGTLKAVAKAPATATKADETVAKGPTPIAARDTPTPTTQAGAPIPAETNKTITE